ncbi:MAG: nuclear transport factor 2 family protein [Nitrospiria bacterium]
MDNDIEAVREANDVFYQAFENLDIQQMDAVWVKEDYVKCVHPGWEVRIGWQEVRDSWVLIFNNTYEIKFSVNVLDILVNGNWAWTICMEMISTQDQGKWVDGRVVSTNLFECRDGRWLLIHHHGSPLLTIEQKEEDRPPGRPPVGEESALPDVI